MRISVETRVKNSPRVAQVRGLFDIPEAGYHRQSWDVDPGIVSDAGWRVGLIVGPSGCGKSTIARELFLPRFSLWPHMLPECSQTRAVVDEFPAEMGVKDVTELLCAVGFSSPPHWLKSRAVLSTGMGFRVDLARLLAFARSDFVRGRAGREGEGWTAEPIAVCDEFTSVVDRQVAKVGSAAVAKTVRARGLRFVAVTCHHDVIEWLQPDWILTPQDCALTRRSVQPRPPLALEVFRTTAKAWPVFSQHHYLSHALNSSAVCFVATCEGQPVAFSAWINQFTARGGKREHRTVVLPDWQGVGIGMKVSGLIASMWKGLGQRATSTTTHPAFIAARRRSPDWKMVRAPSLAGGSDRAFKHAATRMTAGFEYVGPAMETEAAIKLLG